MNDLFRICDCLHFRSECGTKGADGLIECFIIQGSIRPDGLVCRRDGNLILDDGDSDVLEEWAELS